MRFTPAALALGLLVAMTSTGSIGQKPSPLDPRSLAWLARGQAALGTGNLDGATDAFETALALDPRNGDAYAGLARVSLNQGLPGKAIGFYADALRLNPGDVATLEAQGMAMLSKGAIESAKGNLALIRQSCAKCEAGNKLAAAITTSSRAPRIVSTNDLKPVPQAAPVRE